MVYDTWIESVAVVRDEEKSLAKVEAAPNALVTAFASMRVAGDDPIAARDRAADVVLNCSDGRRFTHRCVLVARFPALAQEVKQTRTIVTTAKCIAAVLPFAVDLELPAAAVDLALAFAYTGALDGAADALLNALDLEASPEFTRALVNEILKGSLDDATFDLAVDKLRRLQNRVDFDVATALDTVVARGSVPNTASRHHRTHSDDSDNSVASWQTPPTERRLYRDTCL